MNVVTLPTLLIGEFDPFSDTITIEGTRYSGAIFREGFGSHVPVGRVLRIDRVEGGIVTVTVLVPGNTSYTHLTDEELVSLVNSQPSTDPLTREITKRLQSQLDKQVGT